MEWNSTRVFCNDDLYYNLEKFLATSKSTWLSKVIIFFLVHDVFVAQTEHNNCNKPLTGFVVLITPSKGIINAIKDKFPGDSVIFCDTPGH